MSLLDIFGKPTDDYTEKNKSYLEEFSSDFYNPDYASYKDSGVNVNLSNHQAKITYDGLLARSGAQSVYAVIGYGGSENGNWNEVKYYNMNPINNNTFEILLPIEELKNVNVAFKDGANNWDNNSGKNYVF